MTLKYPIEVRIDQTCHDMIAELTVSKNKNKHDIVWYGKPVKIVIDPLSERTKDLVKRFGRIFTVHGSVKNFAGGDYPAIFVWLGIKGEEHFLDWILLGEINWR